LITNSVDINGLISEFHSKVISSSSSSKIWYFSLGKGLEETVEEKLLKATQAGDWIILENLHLVQEWLPNLEDKMMKLRGPELNVRFRMWITCVPNDTFPESLLEKSIKVAL